LTASQQEKRAIALHYDSDSAPRISAIGSGGIAEQIEALALEHGVPLMENAELARLLSQLDLGDEIPETLYRCVAQVIAFAYRVRGRFPHGWEHSDEPAGPVYDQAETPTEAVLLTRDDRP